MKKNYFQYFLFALLFFACQKKVVIDNYQPKLNVSDLLHLIQENGTDSLKTNRFLQNWQKELLPMEQSYINQNDTIESVFELYRMFKSLTPKDTALSENIGNWDWFNSYVVTKPYFLVSRFVKYSVVEDFKSDKILHEKTIHNFRPPLDSLIAKRAIYLTDEYKIALIDSFLGHDDLFFKSTFIVDENTIEGKRHLDFIQKEMAYKRQVVLSQNPKCQHIYFDKTLTHAKMQLLFWDSGADLCASKRNGIWKFDTIVHTWIQ
jgi:hypothetical protein